MIGFSNRFNFWVWLTLSLFFVGLFVLIVISKESVAIASSSLTLQPAGEGKDSYVFSFAGSENTNFGSSTQLMSSDCGSPPCARVLIQFDLSNLPQQAIVKSANLELYYYSWLGLQDTSSNYPINRVSSNWDEATVTWNNQPSVDSSPVASLNIPSGVYGWHGVDLTGLVSSWQSMPSLNNGVSIGAESAGLGNAKLFYSSDYFANPNLRPKLTIAYEMPVTEIPATVTTTPEQTTPTQNSTIPQSSIPTTKTESDPSTQTTQVSHNQTPSVSQTKIVNTPAIGPKIDGVVSEIIDKSYLVIILGIAGLLSILATLMLLFESLTTGFSFRELMVMIFNFVSSIFSAKRNDKSGIVYDQTSGKPINSAIILIFRLPEIKLIAVKTSDKLGRFILPVGAGNYAISVKKRGFIFPSLLCKSGDVYVGQTLNFNQKSIINVKIPLDPTPKAKSKHSIIKILIYSSFVRISILLFGTSLSIFSLFYLTSLRTYLILSGYCLIWIIEYLIQIRVIKFSTVIDSQNKSAVDLAILRVINPKGKIVQTFVSDEQGNLIPYSAGKNYKIEIERVGYKKLVEPAGVKGYIEHRRFVMDKLS